MTYAMTLDNSWELMTEDEMYDVNGGFLGGVLNWLDTQVWYQLAAFISTVATAGSVLYKISGPALKTLVSASPILWNGIKASFVLAKAALTNPLVLAGILFTMSTILILALE